MEIMLIGRLIYKMNKTNRKINIPRFFGAVIVFNKGRDVAGKIRRWSFPVITIANSKSEALKEFIKIRNREKRTLKGITKSFAPLVKEFNSLEEARGYYKKKGWRL